MMISRRTLYALLGFLYLLSAFATLLHGPTPLAALREGPFNPLLGERLPRLLVLTMTGASLAVSGAVMQGLFCNPLASPMVLGLTSGGSLAVVTLFFLRLHLLTPCMIPLAAILGCLATLAIVYSIARGAHGTSTNMLILTGIATSTLLLSFQGALLYALRDQWQIVQMVAEWEAGSTIDRSWQHVHLQLPLTLIGLAGCLAYRQELNILSLGPEEALALGVNVTRIRFRLCFCVSLLVGGALAAVGVIAFFGLVLPHLIRKIQGSDNRTLLPLSVVAGATLLPLLDIGLRFLHIRALSIGTVSSIIGAGFFLLLLIDAKRAEQVSY